MQQRSSRGICFCVSYGLDDDSVNHILKMASIVAPALATLFGGAAVALRCKSQATALLAAAAKIVQEVSSFRMRVGQYDIGASKPTPAASGEGEGEKAEGEVELNESVRLYQARQAFQKNIEQVASTMGLGAVVEAEMDYQQELVQDNLRDYVEPVCYGEKIATPDGSSPTTLLTSREETQPLILAHQSYEVEHLNCMSSTAYYNTRVKPLLKMYKKEAPRLARLDKAFTLTVLLLTTAATVISALNYQIWVPLVYGASAFLTTFQIYNGWGARQAAMARAVADLTMLETYWASLTVVDRGLSSTRSYIVKVTEAAVINVCQAETGVQVGATSEGAPKEGDKESKKSEKK
eukprot:TRINITY_DN20862_c0_g1_i5.p1 TRINITY_DN20862_c0_g1~~TRINITY_DN20862_c0_g1_i5.p1  ORF type:complete len:350 (+),score=71.29 TRINITY_DN20862_c0_g1_i5:563-1612(+)